MKPARLSSPAPWAGAIVLWQDEGRFEVHNAEEHMNASNTQPTGALRASNRTLIILALAIAMFAVAALAPGTASAGEGGDDIETVRASVTETYNYKIGLLTERKNGTDNPEVQAICAEGINELTELLSSRVATETSIDELWGLKERAHGIYAETVARADQAGMTDEERLAKAKNAARETVEYKIGLLTKWIEGCDNPRAREIAADGIAQLRGLFAEIDSAETADAAYALKDKAHVIYHSTIDKAEAAKEGEETRTEEEKAAKELQNARWSTLSLIERKTAILKAAAEAADNGAISEIFAAAAEEVAGLETAARKVESVKALKGINEQVMAIYYEARDAVAEFRGKGEADDHDKDPARDIEAHLGGIAGYVDYLTEIASATAEESPDTYAAVVAANEKVHKAINAVIDVAESGKKLDTRWQDLADSLKSFKRAFVAHYVSLADGPVCFGGLHVPG
jgi:hypothetical protein